jgi:hypothetical protein
MSTILPLPCYLCQYVDCMCECGTNIKDVRKTTRARDQSKIRSNGLGCRYWVDDWEVGNCVLRIEEAMGLEDVADKLGITKQAVSQAEVHARVKLSKIWVRG